MPPPGVRLTRLVTQTLTFAFILCALNVAPCAQAEQSARAATHRYPAQAFQGQLADEVANDPSQSSVRHPDVVTREARREEWVTYILTYITDNTSSQIGSGLTGATAGAVAMSIAQMGIALVVTAASAGSVTAGAASGATAVLHQAQFLAVAGTFSGNQSPQEAKDMSRGIAWSNFHFFSIPASNVECKKPPQAAELWGTLITCATAFITLELLRLLIKFCCICSKYHRRPSKLFPIPGLEIALFLTQVLGLTESAGYALNAGCREYVIGGAVVLGFLFFALLFIMYITVLGVVSKKKMVYVPGQWTTKEGLWHVWNDTDKCCLPWWRVKIETVSVARLRGSWEDVVDEHAGVLAPQTDFSKTYGSVMTDYSKKMWMFALWIISRDIAVGLILSNLRMWPKTLTGVLMGIYAMEAMIALFGWPWLDRISLINAIIVSWFRVGHVVISVLLVHGIILDTTFMRWFVGISIASLVPLVLQSFIQTWARFIHMFTKPQLDSGILANVAEGATTAGMLVAVNAIGDIEPEDESEHGKKEQPGSSNSKASKHKSPLDGGSDADFARKLSELGTVQTAKQPGTNRSDQPRIAKKSSKTISLEAGNSETMSAPREPGGASSQSSTFPAVTTGDLVYGAPSAVYNVPMSSVQMAPPSLTNSLDPQRNEGSVDVPIPRQPSSGSVAMPRQPSTGKVSLPEQPSSGAVTRQPSSGGKKKSQPPSREKDTTSQATQDSEAKPKSPKSPKTPKTPKTPKPPKLPDLKGPKLKQLSSTPGAASTETVATMAHHVVSQPPSAYLAPETVLSLNAGDGGHGTLQSEIVDVVCDIPQQPVAAPMEPAAAPEQLAAAPQESVPAKAYTLPSHTSSKAQAPTNGAVMYSLPSVEKAKAQAAQASANARVPAYSLPSVEKAKAKSEAKKQVFDA